MLWNCLGIFVFLGLLTFLLFLNTLIESQASEEIQESR